ncbi:MAG: M48 family metallopeptidase [Verrucomicrobia bacterium]|nr:M48 family metallopeptidase [Verrucomicrobiota bacterium]
METEYPANAFQAGASSRTLTGKLQIVRQSVRFQYVGGQVELPLAGLRVRAGGHNSEQVFFEHPQHPDWSIYTSERGILKHDALSQHAALADQVRGLKSPRGFGKPTAIVGVIVLLFLFLLVAALISSKDRLVRYLAFQIPVAWEVNLGNSLLEEVKRQGKAVADPKLEAKLKGITSRLLPVAGDSGYGFQFHILDDTNVNAFALPGGNVVVLSGLLNAAQRPEEIAGVLAHEMAHVTQRHSFRKIIGTAGLYLLIQTLFGDASGIMAVIANSSEFLLRQKHSRDFEREADDVGWQYLIAAKIDPRGMTEFFRTLLEHEKSGLTLPGLLSTHPTTLERIKQLEAKWDKMEPKPEIRRLETAAR